MTAEATDTDSTDPIQADSMAEGARLLDTASGVVECVVRSGPLRGMSIVDTVTTFAALIPCRDDADIEARVAAGTARLTVALLAFGQVGLGIGAVIAAQQITAIERMRGALGPVSMTALPIIAGRVAARCDLVPLQVRAVTRLARLVAVDCCISTVIRVGCCPVCRVDSKRRCRTVRVAAVTADRVAFAAQIGPMAARTFNIPWIGLCFRSMSGEPIFGVGLIV